LVCKFLIVLIKDLLLLRPVVAKVFDIAPCQRTCPCSGDGADRDTAHSAPCLVTDHPANTGANDTSSDGGAGGGFFKRL